MYFTRVASNLKMLKLSTWLASECVHHTYSLLVCGRYAILVHSSFFGTFEFCETHREQKELTVHCGWVCMVVCNQWFSTLSILPLERGWIKHSTTNKTEQNCFAFCTNTHSHTHTHTQRYFWYLVVDVTCAKNVQCIVKYFTEWNRLSRIMSEWKMWAFFLFVIGPKIFWQHEFAWFHSLCFGIDVRNQNCSITKINSIKHTAKRKPTQKCLAQKCWDFCHANNFTFCITCPSYNTNL